MTSTQELIDQVVNGADPRELIQSIGEAKWSAQVQTKWKPPEGFFKQSASKIASGLLSASSDKKQAMGRLNFYINRAGKNLSADDRARLEAAKKKLSKA